MSDSLSPPTPLLEARRVGKAFPGVQALADVDLRIDAGEVLAVVGENGAGKSTLMKILAGVQLPDAGEVLLDGQPVRFTGVEDAQRRGVVLIHQELNLAENLDVAGNVFLGREPTWGGPLRLLSRSIYAQAEPLTRRLGLAVPLTARVADLPIGQQQLVEIARALALRSRVLIMDEPTSSLTERETSRLLELVRELKRDGIAVLYITHRLKEVEAIADRVTVLRDGRNAGALTRGAISHEAMVRLMVGRQLQQFYKRTHTPSVDAPAVLRARGVRWSPAQQEPISFDVRAGEVVALAGLMGAGRSELVETIFGVRPLVSGSIEVEGRAIAVRRPKDAIAAGVALVPEDRRTQGLVLASGVADNISLPSLDRLNRFGLVALSAERELAESMRQRLGVRTASLRTSVGLLSGGNQQKVVLAKWLAKSPRVLILDEPTRGIDVGAKTEIYALMDNLAAQGVAILMVSSDLEEVLGVSDRVLVMHEGRLAGQLSRAELSEEAVMRLATGGAGDVR